MMLQHSTGTGGAAALHGHLCRVTGTLRRSCQGGKVISASLPMPRSEGTAQGVPVPWEPSPASAGAPCLEPGKCGCRRSGWHLCGLFCWDLGQRGGQRLCPVWHPPQRGQRAAWLGGAGGAALPPCVEGLDIRALL